MKTITLLICLQLTFQMVAFPLTINSEFRISGKEKIKFTTSQSDAQIFINGIEAPPGDAIVIVPKEECVTVLVKKMGFISEKIKFCNKKNAADLPKSYFLEMKVDDAFEASVISQDINKDVKLDCGTMDKAEAWKLINKIVLDYFDVIELMDKETGYLYTAWNANSFTQNTIRTRVIIKQTDDDPLTFKVKLVSEHSAEALTPVLTDIKFKEWDRVLKNHKNIVEELLARLN